MSGTGSCFICDISAAACTACGLVAACRDHVAIHRSVKYLSYPSLLLWSIHWENRNSNSLLLNNYINC